MRRRHWLMAGLGLMVLVLAGGVIGFVGYTRLAFGLTLRDQLVLLQLPPALEARVRAVNKVMVRLDGDVEASVPLKQRFAVPLRGSYEADVAFDVEVPLRTTIRYEGMVPIDTVAQLSGSTGLVVDRAWLPKFPLRARVPLRFDFPIALAVPLDTRIRLAYRGPIRFSLDQMVTVPIDTVLKTRMHLARDAEAPVQAAFRLRAELPQTPVPLQIRHAELAVPLQALRWQRTD